MEYIIKEALGKECSYMLANIPKTVLSLSRFVYCQLLHSYQVMYVLAM